MTSATIELLCAGQLFCTLGFIGTVVCIAADSERFQRVVRVVARRVRK
jgi:hypothetical protein